MAPPLKSDRGGFGKYGVFLCTISFLEYAHYQILRFFYRLLVFFTWNSSPFNQVERSAMASTVLTQWRELNGVFCCFWVVLDVVKNIRPQIGYFSCLWPTMHVLSLAFFIIGPKRVPNRAGGHGFYSVKPMGSEMFNFSISRRIWMLKTPPRGEKRIFYWFQTLFGVYTAQIL